MAVDKITFADKVSMIESTLPVINRIRDIDVNEIKDVVNNNADELEEAQDNIATLQPTAIGSLITSNAGTIADQHSYRIGNVIGLSFKLTGVSGTASQTKVIAQLGEGLKPTTEVVCMASVPGNAIPGWIRTSGEICMVPTGNISNVEVVVNSTFLLE